MIGRYKRLEKIGEGEFRVMYIAEQRKLVKRQVALNVIKLGMDTKQVVAAVRGAAAGASAGHHGRGGPDHHP
jgi:hypothetical protein